MTVSLTLLVFLGGVLTILSPCILPVLPFVFSRAQQPFLKSGLPMLLGMALTFAAVATLAAVGGAWAAHVNQYGRVLALIVLSVLALTLLSPRLADALAHPFIAAGNRLSQPTAAGAPPSSTRSLLLGVATGLLWAPCAGPILGLVLTGAAISGPSAHTTLLLLAYAAGACTSLAIATLAGARVFAALKSSLGAGEWVRRGLGIAVLLGVAAIAFGWDGTLARLSFTRTDRLEQALLQSAPVVAAAGAPAANPRAAQNVLSSLQGASSWLNSPPLSAAALQGKVVLIDFWTYSCINCLRSLPYVESWYRKYKDYGLIVIGAHAPEFAFERDRDNVQRAVAELGIDYPVALDNQYLIWRAFDNQYWPAHYFLDATGRIRAHHFGEGDYRQGEQTIRDLLTEAGVRDLPATDFGAAPAAGLTSSGLQAAADGAAMQSPETYLGYTRAERFSSPSALARQRAERYEFPTTLEGNQWALAGNWLVGPESAQLQQAGGRLEFRFHARDLHLVLSPPADGHAVRYRVLLDGMAPNADHGTDIDAAGDGVVSEQRLYQLIRQSAPVRDRTFSIEFLDPGLQAFAFTFG
jgi:cytochrome c biogenesis protein CcdA/thiol-disulfide isomerase/thioredoxin